MVFKKGLDTFGGSAVKGGVHEPDRRSTAGSGGAPGRDKLKVIYLGDQKINTKTEKNLKEEKEEGNKKSPKVNKVLFTFFNVCSRGTCLVILIFIIVIRYCQGRSYSLFNPPPPSASSSPALPLAEISPRGNIFSTKILSKSHASGNYIHFVLEWFLMLSKP